VATRFGAFIVAGLLQGLLRDEPNPEIAKDRIIHCLREVTACAEKRGVDVVIEPVNHLQVGFNNTVSEVLQLIETVNSPALKPMVDTIHLNIEESSLVQPILDCRGRLRHVHLCESNGSVLGSGNIDFATVLNALEEIGYEGFASVKVYRGATLEEGAKSGIDYLRTLRLL
jgi:sugar phosphate isomerase/epimerase